MKLYEIEHAKVRDKLDRHPKYFAVYNSDDESEWSYVVDGKNGALFAEGVAVKATLTEWNALLKAFGDRFETIKEVIEMYQGEIENDD